MTTASMGVCDKVQLLRVGTVPIWQRDGNPAFFFKAGASVDADAAPKAYHPTDDTLALDYLHNAGVPGNWWGVVADPDGQPITQQADKRDPAPEFCVSVTSLQDETKDPTSPYRYIDATAVPYIVLPGSVGGESFEDKTRVKVGDFAMVVNGVTRQHSPAIYADQGPADVIGEISIALAKKLGLPSDPKGGMAPTLARSMWCSPALATASRELRTRSPRSQLRFSKVRVGWIKWPQAFRQPSRCRLTRVLERMPGQTRDVLHLPKRHGCF